jgi:uncharacterized protein (TIGR02186 family)
MSCGAHAEDLIISLSTSRIAIHSNFTGADLALFGAITHQGAPRSADQRFDTVVTIRGPRGTVLIRRKLPFGPFWLNRDERKFVETPAYAVVLSNRPLTDIADLELRQKLRLGLEMQVPLQPRSGASPDVEEPSFRNGLIRIRRDQLLYREDEEAVRFLTQNFFQTSIPVPGTAPLGTYDVEVDLFAEDRPLARATTKFVVSRSGSEERIAQMARHQGALYGIAAVLISLMFGWLATIIFRRD